MDIQEKVMADFAARAAAKEITLRGTKDSGRYANVVRVKTEQGSTFDGRTGKVVRVQDGTVFVRVHVGSSHFAVLPFAPGELEVVS